MIDEETKILAHVECLLLWDHLAQTGERNKSNAIFYLHDKHLLYKWDYKYRCPFCDIFRKKWMLCDGSCFFVTQASFKCTDEKKGPYYKWKKAENSKNRKKYARQMFKLVQSFDPEL